MVFGENIAVQLAGLQKYQAPAVDQIDDAITVSSEPVSDGDDDE